MRVEVAGLIRVLIVVARGRSAVASDFLAGAPVLEEPPAAQAVFAGERRDRSVLALPPGPPRVLADLLA